MYIGDNRISFKNEHCFNAIYLHAYLGGIKRGFKKCYQHICSYQSLQLMIYLVYLFTRILLHVFSYYLKSIMFAFTARLKWFCDLCTIL